MHHPRPLALALPLILALLAGCDDSTPSPDATPPPTPDSAAPSDTSPAPDTDPTPDATPDATPFDATPDTATPPDATPDATPTDATPDALPDAHPTTCRTTYHPPTPTGQLQDPDLAEASGLTPSATRTNILWTHTDSGGPPRLYAIDTTGTLRGSIRLPVENTDFEDIATAPCPDQSGPCLWIADTGDNNRQRADTHVYATPEPNIVAGEADRIWTYALRYPDGPIDVEALAVAPDGSTFYLIEKVDGPIARIYAPTTPLLPLPPQPPPADPTPTPLTEITRFLAPGLAINNGRSITAAALHPTGQRLLIRVYTGSYEYRLDPGQTLADLPAITPITVALGPLTEPQGEAITYDADGIGIYTVSEADGDAAQPLNYYRCRD